MAYVQVWGRTIQALKARINIAQGEALINDLQKILALKGRNINLFHILIRPYRLKLRFYITHGFALGYINSHFQRLG